MGAPRPWGYWTEGKLEMLSAYLHGFTTASKRARSTVYLDLFAGQLDNVRADTGAMIPGSVVRALETDPPFTVLRAFERSTGRAASLEAAFRSRYPHRDVAVVPDDVHRALGPALERLDQSCRYAPTFAFVDPDGVEARWSLFEALADFKAAPPPRGGPRRPVNKVEVFFLMCSPAITRVVNEALDPTARARAVGHIDQLFGSDEWRPMLEARIRGELAAAGLRDELTNLLRWRLETVLGYRYTHTYRVHNVGGVPLYDLVFATDHDVGHKIMRDVYARAAVRFPQMQRQAQALRYERRMAEAGQEPLFAVDLTDTGPIAGPIPRYEHASPITPFGQR